MNSTFNKIYYYLLLFAEIVVTIGLGILGNKLSESIVIAPTTLLIYTVTCVVLLFLLTLILLNYENVKGNFALKFSLGSFNNFLSNTTNLIFNRVATIFPFALILGIVVSFISISVLPGNISIEIISKFRFLSGSWGWNDYDVVGYLFAVIALYVLKSYKSNSALALAFGLGYATGLAGTTLLFRPNQNDFMGVALAYLLIVFTATFISSETLKGLFKDIRSIFQNLNQTHR